MSHRLSRIYTCTGDDRSTGLGDGSRIDKDSARVTAYDTMDEANSAIGVVLAAPNVTEGIRALLTTIQHQWFSLGHELCIPGPAAITSEDVTALDRHLDCYNASPPPLRGFVPPTGDEAPARIPLARMIVRRAERETVALARQEDIRPEAIHYLNRLSDLLSVITRVLARTDGAGKTLWNHHQRRVQS